MDNIKAVVQKVIREGKHGPFAVATSDQLEGSVTFSLEPTVWEEKDWPEEGMVVLLGKLRQKRAGWRAKMGRFWKPSDEQTQQTERSKAMKEMNLNWYGMLTVENIERVADLLRQLLKGKRYTFVAANEFFGFKPEVRTNQELKPSTTGDPINVYYDKDGKRFAGFNVCDSYGVWGCSTSLQEEQYDHEFKNPYFVFEWNKVTITHCAPAGHKLYWVAAIERD